MKRILALLCGICMIGGVTGCSADNEVTVYDSQGAVMATLSKADFPDSQLTDVGYRSYVEQALDEAIDAISAVDQCSVTEAKSKLFREEYALHTAFDATVHAAIDTMYAAHADEALAVGCSIIDCEGNVRAIYSGGGEPYARMEHSPFSTIKPLSVYAPAIENGLIDWSTQLTDKPYKQVLNEDGVMADWPVNPSGGYTYQDTMLVECIRQSLNTAAVYGLKSVGAERSIRFLQESFGMDLTYEQNKLTLEGEDEVIGNIAMGYLYTGVTPTDLAGYYQIFGNGGTYTRPHTVDRIVGQDGQEIYTHENETKQVIRTDTAYIMNRLLSTVVSPGGTGAKAKVSDTELIGKTGTGNEDGGNWFVGVTPEYSCAVWHGVGESTGNKAAALFTEIMENMPKPTVAQFSPSPAVRKGVYCSQSGKLFSSACSHMQIGYYASDRKPSVCNEH